MGFGILMGIIFPLYSSIFVNFKSYKMKLFFIAGCVIAGIFVGAVSFLITKVTIIKKIELIGGRLRKISEGTGDYNEKIKIDSNDAIGELVCQFNKVKEKLNNMLGSTFKNIEKTEAGSTELTGVIGDSISTFSDISNSVETVTGIVGRQLGNFSLGEVILKDFNKSVTIVVSDILELYTQLEELTSIVIRQTANVEKIKDQISNLISSVGNDSKIKSEFSLEHSSNGLIKEIDSVFRALDDDLISINKNIVQIDDISSTTNVLSINATIEATRAGRFGKGFAIVADEIRKLSADTEKMTKAMKNSVSSITRKVTNSFGEINRCQNIYRESVKSINQSIMELSGAAIEISTVTEKISNEHTEIGTLLSNIKERMVDMNNTFVDVTAIFSEMKKGMTLINENMDKINDKEEKIEVSVRKSMEFGNDVVMSMKAINQEIVKFKQQKGE